MNLSDADPECFEEVNKEWETVDLKRDFEFQFKQRKHVGRAIHVAAMKDEPGLMSLLLDRNADPSDSACFGTLLVRTQTICAQEDNKSSLQPIHIAAGRGNLGTMQILVESGARIDAHAKRKGQYHYAPIHEAAFAGQVDAVKFLLRNRADVDTKNKDGKTPLHIACQRGDWKLVRALTGANADITIQDSPNHFRDYQMTPLLYAIGSKFPRSKLYLLTRRCIKDVMLIAEKDPEAARDMLIDESKHSPDGPVYHESWRKGLAGATGEDAPNWWDLIMLLQDAPDVAVAVLEVLTLSADDFETTDSVRFHHPVPQVLRKHHLTSDIACSYNGEFKKWNFHPDPPSGEPKYPAWHDEIAPGSSHLARSRIGEIDRDHPTRDKSSNRLTRHFFKQIMVDWGIRQSGIARVKIKTLILPNIMRPEVLLALSRANPVTVFKSDAAKAIADYAWANVADHYMAGFLIRCSELIFLIGLVVPYEEVDAELNQDVCWMFLRATSLREMLLELEEIWGYVKLERTHGIGAYVGNRWNLVDNFSYCLFGIIVWSAPNFNTMQQSTRRLFAVVTFLRWIQLLYMLRAFSTMNTGHKIIPILMSFFSVGGMFIITSMMLLAFVHAFSVLLSPGVDVMTTLRDTIRILLLGDGDGIDFVLSLEDDSSSLFVVCMLAVGVVVYCICTLNLFIAVHGSAFENAKAVRHELFYSFRCSICLNGMFHSNYLPPPLSLLPRSWMSYCLSVGVFSTIAAKVYIFTPYHHILSSVALSIGFYLGDRILLQQRKWWRLRRTDSPSKDEVVPLAAAGDHQSGLAAEGLSLDGKWISTKNKAHFDIVGFKVRECSGDSRRLEHGEIRQTDFPERQLVPDSGRYSMNTDGHKYSAELIDDKLHWDDEDIWEKQATYADLGMTMTATMTRPNDVVKADEEKKYLWFCTHGNLEGSDLLAEPEDDADLKTNVLDTKDDVHNLERKLERVQQDVRTMVKAMQGQGLRCGTREELERPASRSGSRDGVNGVGLPVGRRFSVETTKSDGSDMPRRDGGHGSSSRNSQNAMNSTDSLSPPPSPKTRMRAAGVTDARRQPLQRQLPVQPRYPQPDQARDQADKARYPQPVQVDGGKIHPSELLTIHESGTPQAGKFEITFDNGECTDPPGQADYSSQASVTTIRQEDLPANSSRSRPITRGVPGNQRQERQDMLPPFLT